MTSELFEQIKILWGRGKVPLPENIAYPLLDKICYNCGETVREHRWYRNAPLPVCQTGEDVSFTWHDKGGEFFNDKPVLNLDEFASFIENARKVKDEGINNDK